MNQLHVVGSASGQYSECAGELVCLSLRNVVGHERLPCAPTSSGNGRQPGRSGQESPGRSQSAIRVDRPAVLKDSLRNCPNYGVTEGRLVSERVPEDNWNATAGDFAVPTLILHGDADRILPAEASSRRQAEMIKKGRYGDGALSTDSGVLANTPCTPRARFGDEKGTNPEKLIAAAHPGTLHDGLRLSIAARRVHPCEPQHRGGRDPRTGQGRFPS